MGFLINKIRTFFWSGFYSIFGACFFTSKGRGCKFEGWIDIPQRGGNITLGDYVRICRFVEFSVPQGGFLSIGNNSFIGRGSLISAKESVVIGKEVLLAENVCIHDNDHSFACLSTPISKQGFYSKPVIIEDDCWLGAKVVVLKGCHIRSKAIIGASSLVTRDIELNAVVFGVPAAPYFCRFEPRLKSNGEG